MSGAGNIQVMLLIIWNAVGGAVPLVRLPAPGLGILLAIHGVYAFVMKTPEEIMIERERRTRSPEAA